MNPNILWGTITFCAWATFSTWYYVNYIKDFEEPDVTEIQQPEIEEVSTESASVVTEESPSTTEELIEEEVPAPTLAPISISKTLLFDLNSSELNDGMAQLVAELKDMGRDDLIITIEGHACDIGTKEYNIKLSQARALGVAEYIKEGLPDIKEPKINFYGEGNPVFPNDSEANRRKNRRVTVTIKSQP